MPLLPNIIAIVVAQRHFSLRTAAACRVECAPRINVLAESTGVSWRVNISLLLSAAAFICYNYAARERPLFTNHFSIKNETLNANRSSFREMLNRNGPEEDYQRSIKNQVLSHLKGDLSNNAECVKSQRMHQQIKFYGASSSCFVACVRVQTGILLLGCRVADVFRCEIRLQHPDGGKNNASPKEWDPHLSHRKMLHTCHTLLLLVASIWPIFNSTIPKRTRSPPQSDEFLCAFGIILSALFTIPGKKPVHKRERERRTLDKVERGLQYFLSHIWSVVSACLLADAAA